MEIEPYWGVVIGSGIGVLIREIYLWYKQRKLDNNGHFLKPGEMWPAILSIIFGLLFIIPFIGLIGFFLGNKSLKETEYKKMAISGIVLNILTLIFWGIMIGKNIPGN